MEATGTERVRVVAPGQTYVGKQGFTYSAGASAETVGTKRICMNVLPMPDGKRAKVHYHSGIETISYLLDGNCAVYYCDKLEGRIDIRSGEQIYISGRRASCVVEPERSAVHLDRRSSFRQRPRWHRSPASP